MRRSGDAPRGSGARAVAAAVIAAVATFGGAAPARPFQLEDALQREGFGDIALAPGGRWLVVEQRGPFAAGARFDFGRFNPLFRTELKVADLQARAPLRPLFAAEPGVGYRAGPISPDGALMAVFRLSPGRWELGLVTLATGAVRWTGVTPEIAEETRTLQWLSPRRLAVIATAPGALPFELRAVRPQAALPALWAAAARGEAAVTAVGSGRYLDNRPRDPPKRLLVLSTETGAIDTLGEGDFVDLEASPSGRRLALVEAGEDIPLVAGRQVQGAYGIAVRRMRLRLLDLATGRVRTPCPACDTLTSMLAWSAQDELLAYVRDDGSAWRDGRLVRIAADLRMTDAAPGLQAAIAGRPERVAAGWWGPDVLLYGRAARAARDDWWRVGSAGRTALTSELPSPLAGAPLASASGLLVTAQGAAWRISRQGRALRLTAAPFARIPRRGEGIPDRTVFALRADGRLAGVLGPPGVARAVLVAAGGEVRAVAPLGPGERAVLVSGAGAVVSALSGGGAEALVWRRPGAPDQVLARINPRLHDLDRPAPIPIAHAGANGEELRSWLFLPATTRSPPPLVVVPYPGAVRATPPDDIWDAPAMAPAATLLGHGYAVLLPSLPAWREGQGPADRLGERVLAIVDAAARSSAAAGRFDPTRLGLWGHSFGGYATAAIVTQTDRFGAAVATAPPTDLVSFHGQFSAHRRLHPEEGLSTPWTAGWTESLQGDMRAPPWEAAERYRRNSPVMQAQRITTPLLLAYGELDGAHPGQAEALFSALYRQNKDAILLTYWGEGHLFGSPGNIRDLYRRGLAFLDAHLMPTHAPFGRGF